MTKSVLTDAYYAKAVAWRGIATLLAAAVAVLASRAGAATVNFAATIDGAQETPPMITPAMASGTFVMDTVANTLAINIVMPIPPPSGEAAAHIHGFAPPGVPAPIIFPLPLGSPKIAVWNFSEFDQANIINGLTYANIHSAANLGGEIRGQILRVPSCGDGIVDGGEQCDDGNNANGDCCSSLCQFEPAASPCVGSGLCASNGACDGSGSCVGQPATGCKTAGKAILLVKNNATDDNKDKMLFKWLKGPAFTIGSPTTTTDYALCLYAGTTAIAAADVPASATLWTSTPPDATYSDPNRNEDGIAKIILKKSTTAGKTKALIKGKGAGLPDPPAVPFVLPVTAQLVNSDGECLEGVFGTGTIIKNDNGQFKAKGP